MCASAPGKAILFGEHAVVYGEPAVAAALDDLRIYCRLDECETNHIRIRMADLTVPIDFLVDSSTFLASCKGLQEPPTSEDAEALRLFVCSSSEDLDEGSITAILPALYLIHRLAPLELMESGLDLSFRSSDLPVGAGLGSSAAMGVACVAALVHYVNPDLQPADLFSKDLLEKVNEYAFYSEILLHGTPSGIDNTVSTYGGAVYFIKTDSSPEMEHFKVDLSLSLVYTHVPRSTKRLVAKVRSFYNDQREIVDHLLKGMGSIARKFYHSRTEQACWDDELLRFVRTNQCLLQSVGVSHPSLDRICTIVNDTNLGAAKLTGAGGGGCAFILWRRGTSTEQRKSVERHVQHASGPFRLKFFSSTVGGKGVTLVDPKDFPEPLPQENQNRKRILCAIGAVGAALAGWVLLKPRPFRQR